MNDSEVNEIYDEWKKDIELMEREGFTELSLYEVLRPKTMTTKYDTYYGFIVCCENEDTARKTHPCEHLLDTKEQKWYYEESKTKQYVSRHGGWIDPKDIERLEVRRLGAACIDVQKGVIMTDFNAG